MSTFVGPNTVKSNLILNIDMNNSKSFRGLATTNLSRLDSNFTGTQYGAGNEWTSDPSRLTKTYISSIKTPIGTGATLITESGVTGYHHLSSYGGGGEDFLRSISAYVKPITSVNNFWIGMLNSTGKGVNFNLTSASVNSESVTNNNYFIYRVPGYPGWMRIGANIEGRYGGWVGCLGYSMLSTAGTVNEKPMYITGIQYETTTMPTNFITSQGSRTNAVSGGGGIINLADSSKNADIAGTGIVTAYNYGIGLKFNNTDGQVADFGQLNFGTDGSKEATIHYWLYTTKSGAWNHFSAGGPGYYYAFDDSNRLVAMVRASDASGSGINSWPTTSSVLSTAINKPCMITAVMKEDNYFKWYVNGSLLLTATPPNLSYYRFYNGNFKIGQGYATTATQFDGTIYSVQAYNRVLTDAEILKSFNSSRGRYGI